MAGASVSNLLKSLYNKKPHRDVVRQQTLELTIRASDPPQTYAVTVGRIPSEFLFSQDELRQELHAKLEVILDRIFKGKPLEVDE